MKFKFFLFTFLVLISLSVNTFAATLGTLTYWYDSEELRIARWDRTPYVWASNIDSTFTSSKVALYINHAVSQWSNAGISTQGENDEDDADIRIYAGSYSNLKSMEPALSTSDAGLTTLPTIYEGEWVYNGNNFMGRLCVNPVNIYIVSKSGKTDNWYKCVTTHEFGHSLGWLGHSSNSSDIMYPIASTRTTLSSRDKNHLNQIY